MWTHFKTALYDKVNHSEEWTHFHKLKLKFLPASTVKTKLKEKLSWALGQTVILGFTSFQDSPA